MNETGIPLYGRYPAHYSNPDEILAIVEQNRRDARRRRELARDEYPKLPWTMDELPGTTWRNPYIFSLETIQEIRENKWGKPGPDPDPRINSMFSIGLWHNERFVISHWVRVDHTSIETQRQWHILEIAYYGRETARAREALAKQKMNRHDSCHGANTRSSKLSLARAQDIQTEAIRQAQEFLAANNLPPVLTGNLELCDLPLFNIERRSH